MIWTFSLDVTDNTDLTRYGQVEQLNEEAESSGIDNVCCLGDFNALHREDYDDNHWAWIEKQDAERGAPPKTRAMDHIMGDFGWQDSFQLTPLLQGKPRKEMKREFNVSTWAFRRIDYALLGPKFNLKVNDAMVLYDSSSDHIPIAIDINI